MPRQADEAKRAGQFGPDIYAAWRNSSLGDITEALEHRLIFELAGNIAGKPVLDAGCGDGSLAAAFARDGALRVAGCDTDPRMLARARDRAASGQPGIGLSAARVQALPFPDNSFDVVTCITVLTFIADADAAMQELARVLRPGGRLIVGDLNKWSIWAVRRRIRGWFGATLWRNARFRTAQYLAASMRRAGLRTEATRGAIFFPPWTLTARLMAPFDPRLGRATTLGAAFVAVQGCKPGNGTYADRHGHAGGSDDPGGATSVERHRLSDPVVAGEGPWALT